ncbi:Tyrosine-protein kinase [Aphelenchoides besseyi]|nr:Tyrosine-protein kinase [Aphelenchoides besseyi]
MTDKGQNAQKLSSGGARIENVLAMLKLEELSCFVGVLSQKGAELCLTGNGVYAIRAEDHGSYGDVILSVRWLHQIHHVTILHNKICSLFALMDREGSMQFATIKELIDHYSRSGLKVDKTKIELTTPAKRPSWLLKNTDVEYSTTIENTLGAGNFCVVYRGKLRRNGDQINVAVKVCKHTVKERKIPDEIEKVDKARLELIQEGQLMRSVRHANVIKFYGIAFDTLPVKIVMELCCGGSVEKLLQVFTDQISVPERVKIAREAAKGLEYLHSKDIVHRDLAVRNILISSQGVSKLADFGLSAFVGDLTGVSVGKEHLPVRWMAPESVRTPRSFFTKSDVWSFGVVVYELFTNGAKIFDEWHAKRIATHIRKGQMPPLGDRFPPSVKSLVEKHCWIVDLSARSTMEDVRKELERIQVEFPIVAMHQLMVNKIPGVLALTELEIEMYRECGLETPMEPCEPQVEKPQPKNTSTPAVPRLTSVEDQPPKRAKTSRRNRRETSPECVAQNNRALNKENDGKEVKAVRAPERTYQPPSTPNRSAPPTPGPSTTPPTGSTTPMGSNASTPPTSTPLTPTPKH